uniref:Uncharacterized protein n=1 Tax=Triticum urartu TaxID=4572 RepID=A0A8R7K466_TRIUA
MTFLPLGESTYCFRLGSRPYWHMHSLCSLILLQHDAVGAAFPMMAPAHGVSCSGLQVAASAPAGATISTTAEKARSATTSWAKFFMAPPPETWTRETERSTSSSGLC